MKISNFKEARDEIAKFVPSNWSSSQSYSLDRMIALMTYLNNPQDKLKIVHVAGTSGKTSTSYFVAALLGETGCKVGLTVSPHITEINERLQIDMVPLAEDAYCAELSIFLELIESSGIKPTYFELLMAFAYWEFVRQKVDYAVIEVGLGGLLDGTNVINRTDKVCVITDIGLDHVAVLGSTLPKIAAQKAGIITNGNAVFCYEQGDSVMKVIRTTVESKNANLHTLKPTHRVEGIDFLPTFQRRNFTLAQAVSDFIIMRDDLRSLPRAQIIHAAHTSIPARMEIFHQDGKVVILDGAHNGQKMKALVEAIKVQFPSKPIAVLVSFVVGGEPRLEGVITELAKLSDHFIITSFSGQQDTNKRSIEPSGVVAIAKANGLETVYIENPNLAFASLKAQPEPILLVTGSFFLLNLIRPLMLNP